MFTSLAATTLLAHGGPVGPGIGLAFVLVPLFWFALIALFFAIFGRRFRRAAWARGGYGHFNSASRSAESTLAERFAQGDIDEKEYRARLEVLRANAYPQPPQS